MGNAVDRDQLLHDLNMDYCEFEEWEDCAECCGKGGWEKHCLTYEAGCGFPHDDSYWFTCPTCNGRSGRIVPAGTSNGITIYDLDERCGTTELDDRVPF